MCRWGDTENVQIPGKSHPVEVDRCIAPIVRALNQAGVRTVACCCGHGHRPGNIALEDGREIVICRDFEAGRAVDAAFPMDIHGERRDD